MKHFKRVLAAAFLAMAAGQGLAFDQAGHFYTAYALAKSASLPSGASKNDRLLVAFCAQLPDMSEDLDAAAVYFRAVRGSPIAWLRWATRDVASSDEVRKMITVQHLLHGLTGGESLPMRELAVAHAKAMRNAYVFSAPTEERAAFLCAWGFALHLLGDVLAHERLDEAAKEPALRKMYATGRGHADDKHDPDYVLCAEYVPVVSNNTVQCRFTRDPLRRFSAWEALWTRIAAETYDPTGSVANKMRLELLDLVVELGKKAGPRNRWGEEMMRVALWQKDQDAAQLREFIGESVADRPCQEVLTQATAKVDALKEFAGLQCPAVWQRYRQGLRERFDSYPGEKVRQRLGDSFADIYVDDPVDRPSPPRARR